MEQSSGKLLAVEGVRGLACFMVLLSHLALTFFPYAKDIVGEQGANYPIQTFLFDSPLGFFYSGTAAVFIFFVLSGYILTVVALKPDLQPRLRILSMSIKRYPRLMLPALFSCLFAYVTFQYIPQVSTYQQTIYGDFNYSFIGAIYSGAIDVFFRFRPERLQPCAVDHAD